MPMATARHRKESGIRSVVRVMPGPHSPWSPSPVKKRKTTRVAREWARKIKPVNRPKF